MALLEIKNLQIEFGSGAGAVRAVDGVTLSLDAGEALCLVGESGSGKSLTALSIARLVPTPPARYVGGEVRIDGRDVLTLPARELRELRGGRVGYVFQEPSACLNPVLRVGTQILESLRVHRPDAAHEREVIRLLNLVGIPAPESRVRNYPHEMSGGMQQRVMIAMALASQPKLLVADEPTTALDVTVQAEVIELLASLRQQFSMSVLLITHNLGIVADLADRIAVMYAGQIVEQGPVREVLQRPGHPYTQALIRSVPALHADAERLTAIPGTVPSPGALPAGCRFHPRCPVAEARCRTEVPALREIEPGRQAACHLAPVLACVVYLVAFFAALLWGDAAAAAPSRPNIVVVLSDDMGYSDIGCYGGEIETPHLDALASNGLRFTQFYNTARCCPTRASLLTGLHPHQTGVGHMMEDRGHAGYRGTLHRRCVTLAEVLGPAGYRTYAVGKWHVTPGQNAEALRDTGHWPLQRGFDRYYGTIHGAGSYFDPSALVRDNRLITVANDPEYQPAEYYYTDAIADHAVRFLREHQRDHPDRPFLLYTAFTAAHWPLHARGDDMAKYRGRYDGGYEPIREARRAKMKSLKLLDAPWEFGPPAERWENVKDKAWEARCMEVYAAQVDRMDQGIGRMVAELRSLGQFDNTVILYLQDNGGCAEGIGRGTNGVPRLGRPSLPPLAADVPPFNSVPKQTRDGWPVRQGMGVMPGGPDTYIAYGRGWAQVSNTPFREYKHWTHEGGISTPLIAHWPRGIPAQRRGQLEGQPAQLVDIMATCVDLAGAAYPGIYRGENIPPMEGTSLKPAFEGQALSRTRPLVWEHEGNRAIRDGRWKLVAKENQPWELYDLEVDRTERHDLAAVETERVKRMAAAWDAWAARASVLPLGAWRAKK